MPELRKFQRSKERVAEVLNYLKNNKSVDDRNYTSITALERSIELIDTKMQEFEKKNLFQ